jgi:hydrogenase expression/formation protein HypC
MCLAIPGKIESISEEDDPLGRTGKANFGGIVREINLAYVPEAKVGDYVLVHVGFALSRVDEAEAEKVFDYLRQMEQLESEALSASSEPVAAEDGDYIARADNQTL